MPSIINAATSGGLISTADTSGVLQLQTASTTALTIDASQQVGAGTATMTRNFNVGGSNAAVGLSLQNTGTSGRSYSIFSTNSSAATVGSLAFFDDTAGAYRMVLDSSGRLGVGTTDPGSYGKIASVGTNTSSALLAVRDEGTSTGNLFVVSSNAAGTIARINANGIGLGGATPSSGIGITFPATQSASSDANTLDDYEEGTWTPTIAGSTTAGTASYSAQGARYTKIGRVVYVETYLRWSGGTGTGNLQILGLPFTSASSGTFPSLSIGYWSDIAVGVGAVPLAFVNSSTTQIALGTFNAGGGGAGSVAYDGAGALQIAGCYTV